MIPFSLWIALGVGPGCRGELGRRTDSAMGPVDAADTSAASGDAEALPPLYGDLISVVTPAATIGYRTNYMSPIAELDPTERARVTVSIHARIDDIRRCCEPPDAADRCLDWQGTVRMTSSSDGSHRIEVSGAGHPVTERCVREAAERFRLQPSELALSRTVDIPIQFQVAR